MSKTISISDEVYEMLKREKNDRSFSEVIADKMDSGAKLTEVAGAKVFEENTFEEVKEVVREGSKGTLERIEDETS